MENQTSSSSISTRCFVALENALARRHRHVAHFLSQQGQPPPGGETEAYGRKYFTTDIENTNKEIERAQKRIPPNSKIYKY